MGWYVVLVLGIPIILFPVAFVWYLNVSGLYQVIRDIRQRRKRPARAPREAEGIAQGPVSVGRG